MGWQKRIRGKDGIEEYQIENGEFRFRSRISRRDVRKGKTFLTRAIAAKWRKQFLRDLDEGLVTVDNADRTLRDCIDYYLPIAEKSLQPSSYAGVVLHTGIIRKELGHMVVANLKATPIRDWLSKQQESLDLSDQTIVKRASALTRVLNVCAKYDFISRNPLDGKLGLDHPIRKRFERKPPTLSEAKKLMELLRNFTRENPKDLWAYLMTLLAAIGGFRRGELVAIRVADLSLARGTLKVSRAICPVTLQLKETKSGDTRYIGLPESVVAELAAYIAKLPPRTEFLFPSPRAKGQPRNPHQTGKILAGLYADLGFPKITAHCWRHFLVSNLASGTDSSRPSYSFESIRLASGHRTRTAFDQYVHENPEATRQMLSHHASTFLSEVSNSAVAD